MHDQRIANRHWKQAPSALRCAALAFALLAMSGLAVAAGTKVKPSGEVYRWTDAQGEVHYSKALPPDVAGLPYDVLSPNGVLLRHVDPVEQAKEKAEERAEAKQQPKGPVPLYTDEQKRQISDRLLLLKYRSEDEIGQAMQQEIDQLQYDRRIVESTRNSVLESLKGQIHTAADRQRAGMEPDAKQTQELEHLRRRLLTSQSDRDKLQKREDDIRSRFDKELQRYRELTAENEASG